MILGDQENYYKFHSAIYDLSRWSFLFGRKNLVNIIPDNFDPQQILDIGSGTGYQLQRLSRKYPAAKLNGAEPSQHMMNRAKRKTSESSLKLISASYEDHVFGSNRFDLITASYSLTMAPVVSDITEKIHSELKIGGLFAVADFYDTPLDPFRKWMEMNHVSFIPDQFDKIIPGSGLKVVSKRIRKAYGGIWSYANILYQKI